MKEKDLVFDNGEKKSRGIIVKGIGDTNVRFSKCCSPVPGDEIVGFITRGRGVSLHRKNCKNVMNLDEDNKKRLIDAKWQDNLSFVGYHVNIRIICDNITGILSKITEVFSAEKIKIETINSHNKTGKIICDIGFSIENKVKLHTMCIKLSKINGVQEVARKNSND